MSQALRLPTFALALAALAASTILTACQTHDRRIYSTRADKNLHTPDPWTAPAATKGDEVPPPVPEIAPGSSAPTTPGTPDVAPVLPASGAPPAQ